MGSVELGDKNSPPQGDLFWPVDDEEGDYHMVTHLGTQRSAFGCSHAADLSVSDLSPGLLREMTV